MNSISESARSPTSSPLSGEPSLVAVDASRRRPVTVREWVIAFERFFGGRGYHLAPRASLLSESPGVLITNASVTPFLPAVRRGETIAPLAVVQPCVRARSPKGFLYSFHMLGLVSSGEHLNTMTGDLVDFLAAAGLDASRLLAYVAKDDDDLLAAIACRLRTGKVRLLDRDGDAFETRWRFGRDAGAPTGRGLTLCASTPFARAVALAGDHSGYFPIGNIIVITNANGDKYVDIGFGIESIMVASQGLPFHAQHPIAPLIAIARHHGLGEDGAAEFARCYLAVNDLLSDGIAPGARGAGYVIRQMVGSQISVVLGEGMADPVDRLHMLWKAFAEATHGDTPPIDHRPTLEAELARRIRCIARSGPAAKTHGAADTKFLKGSLGVDLDLVRALEPSKRLASE